MYIAGHKAYLKSGKWFYVSDNTPVPENFRKDKPCGFCKLPFSSRGYGGCIGSLPDSVEDASCGFGIRQEAFVQMRDGVKHRQTDALIFLSKNSSVFRETYKHDSPISQRIAKAKDIALMLTRKIPLWNLSVCKKRDLWLAFFYLMDEEVDVNTRMFLTDEVASLIGKKGDLYNSLVKIGMHDESSGAHDLMPVLDLGFNLLQQKIFVNLRTYTNDTGSFLLKSAYRDVKTYCLMLDALFEMDASNRFEANKEDIVKTLRSFGKWKQKDM